MRNLLFALLLLASLPATGWAQISIPNTFSAGTRAQSAQVNENFDELGDKALNREGGTITGNITVSGGVTFDGVDVGNWLGQNVSTGASPAFAALSVVGTTATASLTVSNTGATAIDVAGGINAGSGNVNIIGTDGRIPGVSSTYFASVDGSALTGLNGSNISSGLVAASRLGSGIPGSTSYLRGDSQWTNIQAFFPYTATVANVQNTASETNIVSFTVGANEMADGDILIITLPISTRNDTGLARTATVKAKWGATSLTLSTASWSNANTDMSNIVQFVLTRVGNDLWVRIPTGGGAATPIDQLWGMDLNAASTPQALVMSTPTFSSSQTVAISVTLQSASANYYWKTWSARVYRIPSS